MVVIDILEFFKFVFVMDWSHTFENYFNGRIDTIYGTKHEPNAVIMRQPFLIVCSDRKYIISVLEYTVIVVRSLIKSYNKFSSATGILY